MWFDFLRASEPCWDSLGSSRRAGWSPLTCPGLRIASPLYPVAVALPGQVLPRLECPQAQCHANNFQLYVKSFRQEWGGDEGARSGDGGPS